VTRYLSVAEVVAINAEVVRKFGGTHALRDAGLLDSAVARPQSGYYADVFEEAAALFESLSQNHPFVDGNKRTAITATGVFLLLNGFKLLFNDLEAYNWLMGLYEAGKVSKARIEPWLREHAKAL
jgi:death-on-curing protein